MDKMGYGKQPFVVYRHYDKAHHHIHIISTRIGKDGKKINDSNEAKKAIKICRELEVNFGLQQVTTGNTKDNEISNFSTVATPPPYKQQKPFKNSVRTHLHHALHVLQVSSELELKSYLSKQNIFLELAKKDGHALPNKGLRFYGADSGGQLVSYLAGSQVMKNCHSFIKNKISDNAKNPKLNTKADKDLLLLALEEISQQPFTNKTQLQEVFNRYGIQTKEIKYRHIANEPKKKEISEQVIKAQSYRSNQVLTGIELSMALQKMKKQLGFTLSAGTRKNGDKWIGYHQSGKTVLASSFLEPSVTDLLFKTLKPSDGAADPPLPGRKTLQYIKVDLGFPIFLK